MNQNAAYGFEAYLEQSSPAPPPCTPTILREFSVDSAVLWGKGKKHRSGEINHFHLKFRQETKTQPYCFKKSPTEMLWFFSTALIISRHPANLTSKRTRRIDSLESASQQTGLRFNLHTHTYINSTVRRADSLGVCMEMRSVMLCELWKKSPRLERGGTV